MVPTGDTRLNDPAALAEIELYAEVVIAASAAEAPLSGAEIDHVLGLDRGGGAAPGPN